MDWDAIKRFYLDCRSLKAAAERFGVPLATVKMRAYRGKWAAIGGAEATPEATSTGSQATLQAASEATQATEKPSAEEVQATSKSVRTTAQIAQATSEATKSRRDVASSHPRETTQATSTDPNVASDVASDVQAAPLDVHSADSIFSAEVSAFPDAFSPKSPALNSLGEVLDAIEHGEFRSQIDELRRILARDGKAAYDQAKRHLPAFCVSGTTRDRKKLLKHNGLLQLDFDGLDGTLAEARRKVTADPHVAAAFVSPSGDGLKVLLRIDPKHHDDSVVAATRYFSATYGLKHDPQVKEPTRLCFVSHDPDLHRNVLAKPLPLEATEATVGSESRGRPKKEKPWWAIYQGDLRTLDLVKLFKAAGMLGDCLDPDHGKHAVRCPWHDEHGDGGQGWSSASSDTVIFTEGAWPAFKCLHAHCADRTLAQLCEWFEQQVPACIDGHCSKMRVWSKGQTCDDGRPCIVLPELDRADSVFATEVAAVLAPKHVWFNKAERVVHVSVRRFSEHVESLTFAPLEPIEARTAVERHLQTGILQNDKLTDQPVFRAVTMTRECASGLLAAPQFRECLPKIIRILDLPLPIKIADGRIIRPTPGYDPRFECFTDPGAPKLRRMSRDEALQWIKDAHVGFGFRDAQSLTHAIARLITPYCRGLMGWEARFPLWHYSGNRPRAGKDYLAGVTQLVYEGRVVEDAPLERESEETRKRITAALMAGRRIMHFANCQGHIQDATFIGAITSKTFGARNLGSTEAKSDLALPNEIEFSLSANIGLTFRADVEPRTRRISLEFYEENSNGRKFEKPDLHGWVRRHRADVLSAVDSLVSLWSEAGRPLHQTEFNSFPEWGAVVGGVLMFHGLGDPCLPHLDDGGLPADRQTEGMRALFAAGYARHPDKWIGKAEIYEIIEAHQDDDAFAWFGDLAEKGTKHRLGKDLRQFKGRELSGVVMLIDDHGGESQKHRFKFTTTRAKHADVLEDLFAGRCAAPVAPASPASSTEAHLAHLAHVFPLCESSEEIIQGKEGEKNKILSGGAQPEHMRELRQMRQPGPAPTLMSDPARLAEIAKSIRECGCVALDLETYGQRKGDALDPWKGDIRLLSLAVLGQEPWLVDLRAIGYDLAELKTALESVEITAHNAKFDLLWLRVKCGLRASKVCCTLTAARLLSAGTKPGNNLDLCLERYCGIAPAPDHSLSDWGSMLLTDDQLAYAARDVAHLHELAAAQRELMDEAGLADVLKLELQLLPAIVEMEVAGIAVDVAKLGSLRSEALGESRTQAMRLRELLQESKLNPASTKQLLSALQSRGIALTSTDEESLKAADDGEIIPALLAFRAAEKQAQQAETLLDAVRSDGRIHGRFDPTGTATGRFSSKEPNLQNIGRGELRSCFVAAPGHKLIVADYSQIELRAAAAIAGETKMIEAYRIGVDLHKQTAAAVLGKPLAAVTKEDRQLSKAVNFGLLYGQSAPGLVRYAASGYGVKLESEQAESIRKAFFRTYGALRQWHGESHNKADAGAREVRTVLGRRRILPPEASEWERFTALVNTPVQGGCADGMKQAIVRLHHELPREARLISTVHDELIIEAPEAMAEQVRVLVQNTMIEAMAALFPQVPIEVEAGVCEHWGQKA